MSSKPRMEEGPGVYRFWWDEYQLSITASRVRDYKERTVAEVLIESSAPGVPRHLHQAQLNLISTQSRNSLAKALAERYKGPDWTGVLEALCYYVVKAVRRGEPLVELNTLEEPQAPRYLLNPIMPENVPSIIFGLGGTGKSILAQVMAVAMQLPWHDNPLGLRTLEEPVNALYLDWETDETDIRWRLCCIEKGMGLFGLEQHYRRCALPLCDDLEPIQEMIAEHQIGCLIVDSAAGACGGDINQAEPVVRFFGGLRQLKVTSLVLAHTSKNGDDNNRTPFGSTFFVNYARSVWSIRKQQEVGEDTIEVGLFHTKANRGRLQKPLGFRITFGDESVTVKKKDVADIPELADHQSAPVRIRRLLLHNGKMSVKDIAKELELKEGSVRKALDRMRDDRQADRFGEEWGLLA